MMRPALPASCLPTDRDALSSWLRSPEGIDTDAIRAIAQADYGTDEAKHLEALEKLHRNESPKKLGWYPAEVLELTRWIDIGDGGRDRHIRRLFAVNALIRAEYDDSIAYQHLNGPFDSVIALVESALALGVGDLAQKLVGWAYTVARADSDDVSGPGLALALLLLAAVGEMPIEHIAELTALTKKAALHRIDTEGAENAKTPTKLLPWQIDGILSGRWRSNALQVVRSAATYPTDLRHELTTLLSGLVE